jgi:serine/threonine-protein phosphatase 2A regulatory subunit B'
MLGMKAEEREAVFITKLRQCYISFDFNQPGYEIHGKECKSMALRECIDYVSAHRYAPFSEEVYPEVFNMVSFHYLVANFFFIP